jgi:hypothetical protein
MEERDISAGEILNRTASLLRANAAAVAVAGAVLVALGVAIDRGGTGEGNSSGLNSLMNVAMIAMQFWLTKRMVEQVNGAPLERVRFPAFFGMCLLSGIGIVIGLVLLVIPGIVLVVRWSVASPILIGSDAGVVDSLRQSWEETSGAFWPILGAQLVIFGAALAVCAIGVLVETTWPDSPVGAIIANAGLTFGVVAVWHSAVAIYSIRRQPAALSEVFA